MLEPLLPALLVVFGMMIVTGVVAATLRGAFRPVKFPSSLQKNVSRSETVTPGPAKVAQYDDILDAAFNSVNEAEDILDDAFDEVNQADDILNDALRCNQILDKAVATASVHAPKSPDDDLDAALDELLSQKSVSKPPLRSPAFVSRPVSAKKDTDRSELVLKQGFELLALGQCDAAVEAFCASARLCPIDNVELRDAIELALQEAADESGASVPKQLVDGLFR